MSVGGRVATRVNMRKERDDAKVKLRRCAKRIDDLKDKVGQLNGKLKYQQSLTRQLTEQVAAKDAKIAAMQRRIDGMPQDEYEIHRRELINECVRLRKDLAAERRRKARPAK